jgi:hypothetical protein
MIPASRWEWFGHAGQLCVGHRCLFHLCTRVGKHLISTVGDYYPEWTNGKRYTIGAGDDSFFETYVFKVLKGDGCTDKECGCGMPAVDWSEIEGIRTGTAGDAKKQHAKMCKKYATL